jgi:hypothetical protein
MISLFSIFDDNEKERDIHDERKYDDEIETFVGAA